MKTLSSLVSADVLSWEEQSLSPWSLYGDDVWRLDIRVSGSRRDKSRMDWTFPAPISSKINKDDFHALKQTCKRFLFLMATDPPKGRKRLSHSTLITRFTNITVIIAWMSEQGIARFELLDLRVIEHFRAWLLSGRRGRKNSGLAAQTMTNYFLVLRDIYRLREKLSDSLPQDPFPGETTYEAAGASRQSVTPIPFIPDAIAVELLRSALKWVEEFGDDVVRAEHVRGKAWDGDGASRPSSRVQKALLAAAIPSPTGHIFRSSLEVRNAVWHLLAACFIVIGGFVGMRVSEILSLKVGAVEFRPLGVAGLPQAYLVGTLFKTVDEIAGREERWLAPAPAVKAVELMEALSLRLRHRSGLTELFIVRDASGKSASLLITGNITLRVNEFAKNLNLPLHKGRYWQYSTHQLRKTFARFVAKNDRSQLLGLSQHFKHASVSMTARGYVGSDFNLKELVDHESRTETAAALDRMLMEPRLAGIMGEKISALGARFRGRAGEQVRRDYVEFIMAETDLRLHACDYGWCVYQQETSRCGGDTAPNPVGRSPSACLSCANMVIEEAHGPYWQDRKARNMALIPKANRLTAPILLEAISQCDQVLAKLGIVDGGH